MASEVYPDRYEGQENDEGSVLEALGALGPLEVEEIEVPFLAAAANRIRRRPRGQLTKNFNLREFYCKDGTRPRPGRWRTYKALCKQYLEPMRKEFGPCMVTSGYRTRPYNDRIGGEKGSYHVNEDHDVDDVAADVTFARGNAAAWAAKAILLRGKKRKGKGGVGRYARFVHVDTRDYQANWVG